MKRQELRKKVQLSFVYGGSIKGTSKLISRQGGSRRLARVVFKRFKASYEAFYAPYGEQV